jgi:feruloyl-CoA synthase
MLCANQQMIAQLWPFLAEEPPVPAFAAPTEEVRTLVKEALARWNAEHPEGSTRVARALLMSEPPNLDAGEITDKGYVNQRATLERRSALVEALYASEAGADIVVI